MRRIFLTAALTILCAVCSAQENDGIINLFRPTYLTTGIPMAGEVDKSTADVKFQVSLKGSLWKIRKHPGMELFLGYTQVGIWNYYDYSAPIKDNMFMPGVFFNLPWKNNNLLVGAEHRSNGRPFRKCTYDTYDFDRLSRSMNYAVIDYTHMFKCGVSLQATVRAGAGYYGVELSQDLFYRFLGQATFSALYETPGKEFSALLSCSPTFGPAGANVTAELAYRPFKAQYLPHFFIQGQWGYDAAMCDWIREEGRPAPYVRFGILFAPSAPFRMSR